MLDYCELTSTNGFDFKDLKNARQNNYAWSMAELGDYIYVGTGRNIIASILKAINENIELPALIKPSSPDNRAEIWRYKKDGSLPWNCVYKAPSGSGIFGFRFMIQHTPFGGSPCLYAAGYGQNIKILKTTNGCDWFETQNTLQGSSSRAMVSHRGKLYVATVNALGSVTGTLLYRSADPEFYPWELVTDSNAQGFDPSKNPRGAISNMAVFNDRIYVATSNEDGVQVWRTNGTEPKLNDWTLIVDKGFGDPANKYSLSMGVFKNYLYVSGTKQLPLAWLIPMGCDVIRIDKYDNWQLVVGGNPAISPSSSQKEKYKSISGLGSGFNNPFNVYAWQIQEYKGKLLISTFDDSSNMEVILTTLLANREALENMLSPVIVRLLIEIYEGVVQLLRLIRYQVGFDLYISHDGVKFSPVFTNGLSNPKNYGGRILFVDSQDNLYIGTANPFEGCEVWKVNDIKHWGLYPCDENHYANLWKVKETIQEKYNLLMENMSTVSKFIPKELYFELVQ